MVDTQAEPSRQRSAPLPSGIMAARPTLIIPRRVAKEAGDPSSDSPRQKNRSAAIQFHDFPLIVNSYAGPPGYPCHANPTTKNITAARANTHKQLIIICAALRDRPSPALMSANPAAAKGTRRVNRRHSAAAKSGRTSTGADVTLYPRVESDENEWRASNRTTERKNPRAQSRSAAR